jgi:hypothetical protein
MGDNVLTLEQFAYLAAIVSAMADVYTVGNATFSDFFARRQSAPDYVAKGRILQGIFSTYSDSEMDAILVMVATKRIGKREVTALKPGQVIWDGDVSGFGARRQTKAVSYVVLARIVIDNTISRHCPTSSNLPL